MQPVDSPADPSAGALWRELWRVPGSVPGCGPAPQTGFSTALWDPSGKQIWRSVQVHTNRSDSIPFVGEGSLSLNPDGCAEPPSPLALAAAALPLCSLHAAAQKGPIQPPLPPCRSGMCLGLASCTGASGAHACGDVDLDAVGSLDWMHWTSAGPAETKAAAARLIGFEAIDPRILPC